MKIKYTASTKNPKPMRWFNLNVSFLNIVMLMIMKTVNDTTSWMTLSWTSENGPPWIMEPILFAGIMNEYSKNANPQLHTIISISGQSEMTFISDNLRLPYQANVMKMLEMINNNIVYNPFIWFNCLILIVLWLSVSLRLKFANISIFMI